MENRILTLPSGVTVEFKAKMNHGATRQLRKFISSKMTVDPITEEKKTLIDGTTIYEAQDLTLKLLLVQIKKVDGTTLTGEAAYQFIQDMDDEDGEAVYDFIDGTSTPKPLSDEDKKKLS